MLLSRFNAIATALLSALLISDAIAFPTSQQLGPRQGGAKPGRCPDVTGTFMIEQYQLYPENADFDFNSCLLYLG